MSPYPWSSWEPRGRTSSPNHSRVCSICPSGCLCLRSCGGAATERGWIGGGCSPGLASSGLVTLQCGALCVGRRTGLPQDSRSHHHFFLQVNYGSGCSVVPGQRPQPVIRKPWHPGHTPCCPFSGTSSKMMLSQLNPHVQMSWRTGAPGPVKLRSRNRSHWADRHWVSRWGQPCGQRGSQLSGCQSAPFPHQTAREDPCSPHSGNQIWEGWEWGAAFTGKLWSQNPPGKWREACPGRGRLGRWAHAPHAGRLTVFPGEMCAQRRPRFGTGNLALPEESKSVLSLSLPSFSESCPQMAKNY